MQLVTVIVKLRISSRLRELVWVGASPPWRRGPQVRAALASWGPWGRRRRGTRDAARSRDRTWRQSGVYTDQRKWPLGAVLECLCTLLRRELCDASCVGWHERPNRHGVPAAPPRWPPPTWSEKASARAAPPLAWCLRRSSNPHKPPERHIFPEPQIRRGFGSIRG